MSPGDFDFLRRYLHERSGLVLNAEKQYLAESRLMPLVRKHGLASLGELVNRVRLMPSSPLAIETVEAMTTNETFFFRDKVPFEHFRDTMLPNLLAARDRDRRLRIWCAAGSTGQEPYSLAMAIREMAASDKGAALNGFRFDILATDLSGDVLERARAGTYSQFEVQRGLPITLLLKYFTQTGDVWQVSPELRAMVQFRTLNLLNDFTPLGKFDIVFCRNVLIYFDQPTKTQVLNRLVKQIAEDGYLVLGAAETVVGLTDVFKPVPDKRGLYAPNLAAKETPPAVRSVVQRRAL
ncbi:CheR family methyltransferase [Undibacter mobilis]|uniref:protein-glutamate O-methyltransferase n=1 Tax=Undibacter mobilis TaxID=2292256 RepID=A0A371B6L4_9BRAD|nr:protein-glutamate O-methyltransferase CheR [Undibacter mobilis]RDV03229.1 protein-glutamate O-methyltransferase CheR [Undibacter mobilis]